MQTLADCCRYFFPDNAFPRAVTLQRRGGVSLISLAAGQVQASVSVGPKPEMYKTRLTWAESSGAVVFSAQCNCAHSANGRCEHTLATILQLDETGYGPLLASSYRRFEFSTEAEPTTEVQPADNSVAPQSVETSSTAFMQAKPAQPSFTPQKRDATWFLFDCELSLQEEAICIRRILHRPAKGDQPEQLINYPRVHPSVDTTKRGAAAFQLLEQVDFLGEEYEDEFYNEFGDWSSQSLGGPPPFWAMDSDQSQAALKALCQTRRLTWRSSPNEPIDLNRTLRWEGGAAWRLHLALAETDEGYQLSGELRRGKQTCSIEDPVIFFGGPNVVVFDDRIGRFNADGHFYWISALREYSNIPIPHNRLSDFLADYYGLENPPTIDLPENLHCTETTATPRGWLEIAQPGASGSISATLCCDYDGARATLFDQQEVQIDLANHTFIRRDLEFEYGIDARLMELNCRRGSNGPDSITIPRKSFTEIVETLLEEGWRVSVEGKTLRRSGDYSMRIESGVDWFEIKGKVEFQGAELEIPQLLKAIRSGKRFIDLGDGAAGMLPEAWVNQFAPLADLMNRQAEADDESARFQLTQAMLLDSLLAEFQNVDFDSKFQNLVERLQSFSGFDPLKEPAGFLGELRGYQRDGLGWLTALQEIEFGGVLADDMGLGKTVQVLALLEARRAAADPDAERKPSIVVAPKSLVFNWLEEAQRFAPQLRTFNYTGSDRAERFQEAGPIDVLITTYGTITRDVLELRETQFDYAILDEAQAIKNAGSQRAKACRLLQADHRLAMTGTPVENHLGELWSIFEFLNPGMLGPSKTFQSRFGGSEQQLKTLADGLRPFMLRRTKADVLHDLPEKTEQTLFCEMSGKQKKQYDELREYYRTSLKARIDNQGMRKSKIHVLEALLRLRQVACHSGLVDENLSKNSSAKLDRLLEQLEEVVAEGHKALVFSQFTKLLAIVKSRLDDRGIAYEYLDGQTRDRKARIDRFQQDESVSTFLISLKAGGQGLNLTSADYVFILDPWWNPAVEAQAVDRAHRIGQTRPVFAYRFICKDTVEEKILQLQESKRQLADAIITADNSVLKNLTVDDLQMLLG